jgi:hypothetical protein
MRTTITLDPDVAIELEKLQRAQNKTFKAVVNETLRVGLAQSHRVDKLASGAYTSPVSLGRLAVDNVDDVSAVLEELDWMP